MKTKWLIWGIVGAFVLSSVFVVFQLLKENKANKKENIFEYNLDKQKEVSLRKIGYKEDKQLNVKSGEPVAVEYGFNRVYLLLENGLQIIFSNGKQYAFAPFSKKPTCFVLDPNGSVFVGFGNNVIEYDVNLNEVRRSSNWGDSSYFSSIDVDKDHVFVADAGKKVVRVLNRNLVETKHFSGVSGVSDQHGFIVPSMHFELKLDNTGALWVTNPGMHQMQQYTIDGALNKTWGKASFDLEGFSGCCNPFYFDWLKGGNIVTSEKGLVRVKVYRETGDFVTVVAPPAAFGRASKKAPDVVVDNEDNIWLLDFDQKLLRLFVPIFSK